MLFLQHSLKLPFSLLYILHCLLLCHYHSGIITMAFKIRYNLRSSVSVPSTLFLLIRISLAIQVVLFFHMTIKVVFQFQ